jgi:muramoyltetrapeptide carboxypeptidase
MRPMAAPRAACTRCATHPPRPTIWSPATAASAISTALKCSTLKRFHSLRADGRIQTVRGGTASGPLVGGNLAVLTSLAGTPYWPRFDGAILFLEDVNEYIYRIDRMLSTLLLSDALAGVAGVVLGGFTDCPVSEGSFGTLTLDEVFEDYFGTLGVPVFRGAQFGHVKRKWTLPLGVMAEMDADAGTLRLLEPAVSGLADG